MMDKISRQAAIDILKELADSDECTEKELAVIEKAENAIGQLPDAGDGPDKGHWIRMTGDEWCCSCCGHILTTDDQWEHPSENGTFFCEHCGADMRE